MTIISKTIKTSGGDYSSFSAAWAALPISLIGADQTWEFTVYAGDYPSFDIITDKACDSSHRIVFKNNVGDSPRISSDSSISNQPNAYIEIHGITFNGSDYGLNISGSGTIIINRCYCLSAGSGYSLEVGSSLTSYIVNNILFGHQALHIRGNLTLVGNTIIKSSTDINKFCVLSNSIGALVIKNNIFVFNDASNKYGAIDFRDQWSSIISDYNVYYNTNGLTNVIYWVDSGFTISQWQSYSGQDTNSLNTNPQLVNLTSNFNPSNLSSIVVDRGCVVNFCPHATESFNNVTRPFGKAYDIGAYEWNDAHSDQSRVLDASIQRNYGQVLFQQDKRILDSELNLLQKILFTKFRNLINYVLKMNSGFINLTQFVQGSTTTSIKMGSQIGDVNQAIVNGYLLNIAGTSSTNDYENIINFSAKPLSGTRNDLIFLEVWEAMIKGNTDIDFGFNKPSQQKIYKWGNSKYGGTNVDDDLVDPILNRETADRTQLQYEIRVVDGVNNLTGVLCKDNLNTFDIACDGATGEQLVNLWVAHGTKPIYARPEVDINDNPLPYGYHWAIPIAVVLRINTETQIELGSIIDMRLKVGIRNIDPQLDLVTNTIAITYGISEPSQTNKTIIYIDQNDNLLKMKKPNGSILTIQTI